MKKILLPILIIAMLVEAALIMGLKCNTYDKQTASSGSSVAIGQVTAGGVTMKWNVVGTDLAVTLTAHTAGWVSVGFKPTVGMQNANIIIGYISGGTVFVQDNFGNSPSTHIRDTTQNVTNISGTETGGVTQISFQIPLDSGDSQDRVLVIGSTVNIILAYGPGNDFTSMHTSAGAANIKIE
jgi:hypothetical protein